MIIERMKDFSIINYQLSIINEKQEQEVRNQKKMISEPLMAMITLI